MNTATLGTLPPDDRALSADELLFRQRFDVPGLWPASTTEQERENYMLWSYVHHLRARWSRSSRVLRPSLRLRTVVQARAYWFAGRSTLKTWSRS